MEAMNRAARRQVRRDLIRFERIARALVAGKSRQYPWAVGKKAAFEQQVLDLPVRNTDSVVIPQFSVVMWDTANPDGVVMPGSANAGPVAGINQSKGIDPTTGAITTGVQIGQSLEVRNEGVSRALANGVTAIGSPLSAQNTSGQVGPGASAYTGATVGYGLEAGTTAGDVITVLLNPGIAFSLKQIGTFAAPNTNNGTANTQSNFAHGLGYIPHVVIFVGTQGTSGQTNVSAAPDATNVFTKSPVASSTFIMYVA